MKEHGVPNSRLTVIKQTEDYVAPNGKHYARWICECNCDEHNIISTSGTNLKTGKVLSCGCLQKEVKSKRPIKENKRDLSGNFGILWTTNTNEEVYFDLEDTNKILKYSWYKDNTTGYVYTYIDKKRISMHHFLGYYFPDHHNKNKLDNRKENLVPCTKQENCRNVSPKANNTSGIIGVHWEKYTQKWLAYICLSGFHKNLGRFENKDGAIRARLKAEKEYFGEFAPQKNLFGQYGV